jgi:hypothetical protein
MKAWKRTTNPSPRAFTVLAASVAAAAFATLAAGAPSPAQHFSLAPVGAEPLTQGFVEVIHPNGPEIYARHVYHLNGASSNQSYDVTISIWTSSLTCSDDPQFVLPVAVVVTNASGNGNADAVHAPELLAALGLRGLTIGGIVTLFHNGSPAYTTGCQVIELD